MFVVSMKTTRPRLAVWGIVLAALVAVMIGGSRIEATVPTQATGGDTGRVAFLKELGYEVAPEWTDVREIVIPAEFDTAFSFYNELQKECGYDLSSYRGERVKCYTYTVQNYPGTEGVQATLYEYKDQIIAGDISSTAAEGFCHGLKPLIPEQGETNGTTG